MSETLKITLIFMGLIAIQGALSGFLKMAALGVDVMSMKAILSNNWYLSSFVLFFFRVILWQILISKMPLGRAYLTQSFNVVVILFVSVLIFDEAITNWNLIGSGVIVLGIINMFR